MKAKRYDEEVKAAKAWFAALRPREGYAGDRAALARLRRSTGIMDAAAEPATITLYKKLGFTAPDRDLARAALIATVLAHVKNETPSRFAAAIGAPRGGADSQRLVTPLRFKRLVAASTADELLIAFRRAVAILGDTANVGDLARQLLSFTDPDERRADIARTRFAFDYHGAGYAAPGNDDTDNATADTEPVQ